MKQNLILTIVLVCLFMLQVKAQNKPNIIIILTDDQGYADVGFNGATDIPTPNIDRLASEGVVFTQGYVSHPYCSPSRAGILTGRYQARFGHDCNMPYEGENDGSVGTPLSEVMISEALKKEGYRTSLIGKWHVGDHASLHPTNQGFDHWFGFVGGAMNYWGTPNGPLRTIYRNSVEVPQNELTYLTDDFTNEAIDVISSMDGAPFFMYLAYNAPHAPDHTTPDYLKNTEHIEYGGRSVYGAMVNAVDEGVKKIDSTLIAEGIKDNTIIVYLSDNGGRAEHADNSPFRGHKGMLFEGGIRVPFFISWPKSIPGATTYNEPIIALDLFPTLLNAAGGDASKASQLEGVDLLPFIKKQNSASPHESLYWRSVGGFEYAVRKGKFKLYKSGYKNKTLLFDLEKDTIERFDVAAQYPEKVKELEASYKEWNASNLDPGWFDPHKENVILEEEKLLEVRNKSLKSK